VGELRGGTYQGHQEGRLYLVRVNGSHHHFSTPHAQDWCRSLNRTRDVPLGTLRSTRDKRIDYLRNIIDNTEPLHARENSKAWNVSLPDCPGGFTFGKSEARHSKPT